MKRLINYVIRVVCVAAVLVIAAVAALDHYYEGTFPAGVMIRTPDDSVYCTGMTVKEAAVSLDASYDLHAEKFFVRTLDGETHELPLAEYGVTISYEPVASAYMERYEGARFQWLWDILGLSEPPADLESVAYPAYVCDVSVMKEKLSEQEWLNENLYDPAKTVSIVRSDAGAYVLVDETRDLLLKENAVDLICDLIVKRLTSSGSHGAQDALIDLSDGEYRNMCYQNLPYTDKMKDTLSRWEGIAAFQDFQLTYQFGDRTEQIDENVVADWMALDSDGELLFDEDNRPVLDETMIAEYVAYLAATYNTVGIEREFQATRGDIVTVPGGSYGNELDEDAEYEFLLDAFLNKKGGVRIPEYITEAQEKGADDIGNTYIEVDMGNQHMYYYENGKLMLDTPVVTGNTSRRRGTPSKVCYVYFKQKNRVLRGADYATPVKYWMAVDGHIGIHDASWRKEFGGEIYKTNGSHGCINTPSDVMAELYDMVEVGTPVILFY